jgi:hypothetical protein
MKRSSAVKSASLAQLAAAVAVILALAFAVSAGSASTPLLSLGSIVAANGSAAVTGTVGTDGAQNGLTINGQPVGVDAGGNFATVVDLAGASSLDFELTGALGGQQVGFQVPLTGALLGPGGVIPPGVLDAVQQAGLSLLTPVIGNGGQPITLSGGVLDKGQLAGLTVNGQDLLSQLAGDGSFTVQLPGTTKTIEVRTVDKQGVSETRVIKLSTVSASAALGVRIAKVRFVTRGVARSHRLRVIVTVKDRLGRLIRGAKISVGGKQLARRPHAAISGSKGNATVGLRVGSAALGKRLRVVVAAKTPKAKARKAASVRLPRKGHA